MCLSAGASGVQKRALELQEGVCLLKWVLETGLRSFGKTVQTFNHAAILQSS